jgi:hypothetical protein
MVMESALGTAAIVAATTGAVMDIEEVMDIVAAEFEEARQSVVAAAEHVAADK